MSFCVVLGTDCKKDGTPDAILQNRLDKAISFYNDFSEKNHCSIPIIVSGGDPHGMGMTESHVMKQYLIKYGIPPERIIEESTSNSTYDNARNIAELFSSAKIVPKTIYVITSNFHAKRSQIIFDHLFESIGTKIFVMGAVTPVDYETFTLLAKNEVKIIRSFFLPEVKVVKVV
jgi:uncharacterized SAM-binding protein YcdF (DUF218 family)